MGKSHKAHLVASMKTNFIPFVGERGWSLEKRLPEYDSPELRRSFPFGHCRRYTEQGIQTFDVQFDKRGTAKFRLSFGTIPKEGMPSIVDPGTLVSPNWLSAMNAPDAYVLRPSRAFWTWFGFWPWQTASKTNADNLVKGLTGRWSEVESHFSDGVVGPHLTSFARP